MRIDPSSVRLPTSPIASGGVRSGDPRPTVSRARLLEVLRQYAAGDPQAQAARLAALTDAAELAFIIMCLNTALADANIVRESGLTTAQLEAARQAAIARWEEVS